MSTPKKNNAKPTPEELQASLQALIVQGKKDGMIKATDLNALLEKMDMTAEKIEEVYDRFEAMNIQIITVSWSWAMTSIWPWMTAWRSISIWPAWKKRIWWTPWTWPRSTTWTTRFACI